MDTTRRVYYEPKRYMRDLKDGEAPVTFTSLTNIGNGPYQKKAEGLQDNGGQNEMESVDEAFISANHQSW